MVTIDTNQQKIGFIGLGAMGSSMAKNLALSGKLHLLWNRTTETAKQLSQVLQIPVAQSIEQLSRECNLIFICIARDEDVLSVIKSIEVYIKPNTIIIDTSTVSRQTAQHAAKIITTQQGYFFDAPVSGGVEGAKKGTLSMMVGGNEQILKQLQDILDCICTCVVYMGENGSGQATKAVNQIMAAGINQAVTDALAFAVAEQLPMDKVIDVVSAGAAGNWFLNHRGHSMVAGDYETGFKVKLHHKDLTICQAMAQKHAINFESIEKTVQAYAILIEQGFGEEDISALYRLKIK